MSGADTHEPVIVWQTTYAELPSHRYAHIVEESVHPFQALCGVEFKGPRKGPRPDEICPKCLAIMNGIDGAYLDES